MKRLLPIILAVALAVIAAGLVFFYTRGAEQRVLEQQAPVTVLVSTGQIPQGLALGDAVAGGLAEQTQVPGNLAPAGAIGAVTAENASLIALNNVDPGQILLASNFVTELPEVKAITVPSGQIAVSFSFGDTQRVGNFIRPGDEVVVFATYAAGIGNPEEGGDAAAVAATVTRVLLDRALVLAVGDSTSTGPATNPDGTPAAPVAAALLTLALDQAEAEKMIQASQSTSLYLGLPGEGTEIVANNGTTSGNLFD